MRVPRSDAALAAGAQPPGGGDHAGLERELKFLVDGETFKAAQTHPLLGEPNGRPAWRRLLTTYFDTAAGDLMRHGVTLRMRKMRGGYLMGIKRGAKSDRGVFERAEVEVKVGAAAPDLAQFAAEIAADIDRMVGDRRLAPVFVTDVRRSVRTVEVSGAAIEVAFDSGFLIVGPQREPVREIEMELKTGEPAALYLFGLSLADALPVQLGVRSKAARAAQLLSPKPPTAARALPPAILPETSLDEAIGVLLRNCLAQFLGNWPAITSGDAIEAVHQMRISMRRLRAALGLFRRVFPCAEFEGLRAEAKRIATGMGDARDWDVFAAMVRSGPFSHLDEIAGLASVLAAAQGNADAGHAAALALINDRATTRFALSLEQFVASRGWRNVVPEDQLLRLAEPVAHFAAHCVDRLHRKLRKRGRHFDSLTPTARHELRIALKQVRYATDFFGHLFEPDPAVRRYARRAADLQDLLGQFNDAIIAQHMIKHLDVSASVEFAYGAGAVAGWCGRGALGDRAALRSAWRALKKSEPYWRGEADTPE